MAAQQPRYARLSRDDHGDVRGDDLDTKASEVLMGHGEKNWEEPQVDGRARHGWWRRFGSVIFSIQGLLNALLLYVILGLLVDSRLQKNRYGHFEGNGDITGFAPRSEYRSLPAIEH